jgi:hypothetical protein
VTNDERTAANLQVTLTSILSGLGILGAAPLKAVGIPTEKTEVRQLDGSEFTQEEPIVGKFIGKMWLCSIAELDAEELDDFLTAGWDRAVPEDHYVIRLRVKSVKPDEPEPWTGEQVWGIQDNRYTGRVEIYKGPGKAEVALAKLVYDYLG